MTSLIRWLIGTLDVNSPFRYQSLRFSLLIHQHVPRISLVLERAGVQGRQVQSLRHLPKPGGKVAVVDVPIIIRVELVEQSLDVSFGDAEVQAHRRKILVFDLPGLVDVAGGKQPPEVGSCSVHRLRNSQTAPLNSAPMNPARNDGPSAGVREPPHRRSLVQIPLWAGPEMDLAQIKASGPDMSAPAAAGVDGCCRNLNKHIKTQRVCVCL